MKVKHVIVLHGLYMSGFVMRPLCSRLEESGMTVLNITYNTLDPHRDTIFAQIDECISNEPAALVCHSMGGLIARAYLEANSPASQNITKVITLGTPHKGSHIAQKMKQKGFLISNAGQFRNVLKIRPPLVFEKDHADSLCEVLEETFEEVHN